MNKQFKDVKKGDWAFTIAQGWVQVIDITSYHKNTTYPITCGNETFTQEGKHLVENMHPSAWTYDPFNNTKPPEPTIDWSKVPPNTNVLVRDNERNIWMERNFAVYANSSTFPFYVANMGEDMSTTENVYPFKYCKLDCEPKPEWLK